MRIRTVFVVIFLVLLILVGLAVYAWMMRPKLIDIQPNDGASSVPVTSQIRLEFSQSMKHASVGSRLKFEPAQSGGYSWEENILIFTPDQSWPNGQEISVTLDAGARAENPLAFPMQGESWSFTTRVTYLAYLWPSDGPADIYALNPVTGEVHQYTHRMGVLEFTSNNEGNKIFFSASNVRGGSDLYELDLFKEANTSNNSYKPRKLLDCGSTQCRSPAISYDGKNLAYEHLIPSPKGELGPAQIWKLNLSDLRAEPIGQVSHETIQPCWSSTGWLAYYDRTNQVYEVIHADSQVMIQLINQTGQPGNWSPDGKFLLAPEIIVLPSN
jgi:hypothetical protein